MRRAPGQKLLAVARRLLSRAELDRVIEPAIADLQHEWQSSDGSPLRVRVGIRGRAYMATLFVVSRHLLVGAARASFTPLPWAIVRYAIVPSIVMLGATIGFRLFLRDPRSSFDAWLLDVLNWASFQAAWLPFLWPTMLQRRTLEWARLPSVRASDIARLTAVWCVLVAAWTGWIGPLLRRHYLIAIGQAVQAAAAEQQTLPELIGVMSSGPLAPEAFELHRRLLHLAAAAVAGTLAWIALRQQPNDRAESSFFAHFARGLVLTVAAIAIATACEPAMGPIASEWIGVAVAAAGTGCILVALRLAARVPRESVERDA